jgi:hypothetical protein
MENNDPACSTYSFYKRYGNHANLFAVVRDKEYDLMCQIIKSKGLAVLNSRHDFLPIRKLCEWVLKGKKIIIQTKVSPPNNTSK